MEHINALLALVSANPWTTVAIVVVVLLFARFFVFAVECIFGVGFIAVFAIWWLVSKSTARLSIRRFRDWLNSTRRY